MGLLLCRLTNKSSSFYSLSAVVPAEEYLSAFVLNFNFSFSIGLWLRAERSMNSGTAASPTVSGYALSTNRALNLKTGVNNFINLTILKRGSRKPNRVGKNLNQNFMYLIHEVFNAKPGKAKELVKKFKQAAPYFEKTEPAKNFRILTDVASDFWSVVFEYEVEDIGLYLGRLRSATSTPEVQEIMKGYMDLVEGGKREIFIIE